MRRLGYNVTAFIDADKAPTPGLLTTLAAEGVGLLTWRAGRALEDELFICMTDAAIDALLHYAIERIGRDDVAEHIRSKSEGHRTLEAIEAERAAQGIYQAATRELLGRAARVSKNGWFKSVSAYQHVGRRIVGPQLQNAEPGFVDVMSRLWAWTMPPELDLFAVARGSVSSARGLRKTQLIADTLAAHMGSKPILVLTHTNAGVAALRARMATGSHPHLGLPNFDD